MSNISNSIHENFATSHITLIMNIAFLIYQGKFASGQQIAVDNNIITQLALGKIIVIGNSNVFT